MKKLWQRLCAYLERRYDEWYVDTCCEAGDILGDEGGSMPPKEDRLPQPKKK
jgi:hypothetical protein